MKCAWFFIFEKGGGEVIFIVPIWKSIIRSEIAVLNLVPSTVRQSEPLL